MPLGMIMSLYEHLDPVTVVVAAPILPQSNPSYRTSTCVNDNSSHPPIYEHFDDDAHSEYEDMAK